MKKTIYLIRHAEADGNLYCRAHGVYDGLVSKRGKEQIKRLTKRFQLIKIEEIYSSASFRARLTASLLATTKGLTVQIRPNLHEIDFGNWEDKPWGEIERLQPALYETYKNQIWNFSAPNGESMKAACDRLYNEIIDIVQNSSKENIAIVTHGISMRAMITRIQGKQLDRIPEIPDCDNTSVTCLEMNDDNSFNIVYYGDNSHLDAKTSKHLQPGIDGHEYRHLWYMPIKLEEDTEWYLKCREDCWRHIHGSMKYYEPADFLRDAMTCAKYPEGIQAVMYQNERIGVLQSCVGYPDGKSLHLPLVYLSENYRGKGLGKQIIGEAQSLGRKYNKTQLRLRCSETNHSALKFYTEMGFEISDTENAAVCQMLIMTKNILPN